MNKRLFSLLILIPFLLFMADQALSNPGPGDKRKQRKAAKAAAEAQAANSSAITQEEGFSRDYSARETARLKNYFDTQGMKKFVYRKFKYVDPEQVPEPVQTLVTDSLIDVMEDMDPVNLYEGDYYPSRCWTGYRYGILANSNGGKPYRGLLCASRRCNTWEVAYFRFDLPTRKIEVKLPLGKGYVGVEEYARLRKTVSGAS